MQDIIKKAEELGRAIRDSDVFKEYMEISGTVAKNEDDMNLLQSFMELTQTLAQKEHNLLPIEQYEKEEYQELLQKIEDNEVLKSYISAQNDFFELMKEVEKYIV